MLTTSASGPFFMKMSSCLWSFCSLELVELFLANYVEDLATTLG